MNKWIGIGRLTKDPELRYTPSGLATCSFTVAIDRPFTNQQGNREADFINVVTWRKQAENVAKYVSKGRLVAVEGRVQTRNYENNEGRRVFVTEVVSDNVRFLESANQERSAADVYEPANNDPFKAEGDFITNMSDKDLPF